MKRVSIVTFVGYIMFKKFRFLISLAFVLLLASTAHAQGPWPPQPQHSDPFWQVAYWNNTTLSDEPVVTDTDQNLDHDWGSGSPHTSVNADHFSARWKRYVDLTAGTYRFTATSDDGVRVYVSGHCVIDQWHDHPPTTFTGDVSLTAGHHLVVVEYYENAGHAVAKVSWTSTPLPSQSWRGEYFANRLLNGPFVLVRDDANVDFDWGYGSPASGIPSDGFSARWTRTAHFESGSYRFTATSDDGIRVFVDGRPVIDQWYDHATRPSTADVSLTAGDHLVVVEYYENTGYAVAKVTWKPTPDTPQGWRGEYFDNPHLSGSPVLVRDDANINFNWGDGSPAASIPSDRFSVRWTRTVYFEPGSYRFTVDSDDGARLWVNGHLLVDWWRDQPFRSHSGTIYVSGDVPIKLEYYENGGAAAVRLAWVSVGEEPPPPPPAGVVVVDDTDHGLVKGGSTTGWHTAAEGYGGHLTWARNNDWRRPNYNWARWYPDLTPGRYEVFVYIPERYTTTSNARYWVSHRDGYALRLVNQSTNGDRWVSLGTYWFRGTRDDYASLADVTYEPYASRLLAFDAVKWEPR